MAALKTEPDVEEKEDEVLENGDVEDVNTDDASKKKKKKKRKKKNGQYNRTLIFGNGLFLRCEDVAQYYTYRNTK